MSSARKSTISFFTLIFLASASFIFILNIEGCATAPKAELAANASPTEELSLLDSQIAKGYANHYEVLDNEDFSKAVQYRDEATKAIVDQRPSEKVLESVAHGDAFIERAKNKADTRRSSVESILTAREAALSAGIRHTALEKKLEKVDDRVRSASGNFSNELNSKDMSKIQTDYYDLELMAIQNMELNSTEQLITQAKKNNAEYIAPDSYKASQIDFDAAKNAIAADRHNEFAYRRPVNQAYLSAKTLSDVTNLVNSSNQKTDERAALQIVMQSNTIQGLQKNLETTQNEKDKLAQSLHQEKSTINEQASILADLKSKQQMQNEIQSVQNDFNTDEAEVFQQGDKVIIRLKKMNFPSGSAKIPSESQVLLNKVTVVVAGLNPADITVEGHTDAIGNAKINKKLSLDRAQAVSEYLEKDQATTASTVIEAVGRGYEKPIASNKTASGRAQNRRVDLIITPKAIE